jgi:holo-[acyl-carrier protein] synthase
MIKGIGIDVVEINRIEELLTIYGDRFLKKIFTDNEIEYCKKKARPQIHFSGRWAAKEAFYKALPPSCQQLSSWKSVEVKSEFSQKPVITVCDRRLEQQMQTEGIGGVHVSISHEEFMCVAVVVFE